MIITKIDDKLSSAIKMMMIKMIMMKISNIKDEDELKTLRL